MRYRMPKFRPARRARLKGRNPGAVAAAQAAGWDHDREEARKQQAEAMAQATHHAMCGEHAEAEACIEQARQHGNRAVGLTVSLQRFADRR